MLEDFLSDSPFYQRILRKGEEKGFQQGRKKAIREAILDVVQVRFPDLVELAKQQISRIQDLSLLRQANIRIIKAESRQEAERVLLGLQGQQDTSGKAPS